ncbi:MAG: tRNA (adenosine(37)-N6)-dimethylallyltransferase MiaA [Bacteroidales bacterium]|nr:tRNA (adenosine(37)-N6)-dimethylallyltransferase MiaA [Bacteroidales bacterium]MBR5027998.1 tRNA (adenosine(37)-N6)-dimethylallyltransferase MiaA [Bacteroidales bacterium]
MSKKTLFVIVGPTAIGKTATAIRLAQHLGTEILSCDSRQFYKELNIGVARPSEEELAAAKHHFIANLSIHDSYNVSMYEHDALALLDDLFATHDTAVAVGGSGLYVDALCQGITAMPDPDPEIRAQLKQTLETEGIESLRNQLRILDPDYYYSTEIANPLRIIRGLEMCLTTGRPFSQIRKSDIKERPFDIVKIGLTCPREELYNRINLRVDQMVGNGLEDEARGLLPYRHLNALNTVGYKEFFDYFDGKITLAQAITDIKTHTRRYAKRQITWLQRYQDIQWFERENVEDILKVTGRGK